MRGGEIVVHGDAGAQAGAGLRRGLIAVAGRVGEAAGLRMLAGTIVALGGLGAARGGRNARAARSSPWRPRRRSATFVFSCVYRPPFLALYLRRLRALGLAVTDEQLDGALRALVRRRPRAAARRDPDLGGSADDALAQRPRAALADRLAADADAPASRSRTLSNGTRRHRLRRAGARRLRRRDGAFAEICMAGLGSVAYAPLVLDGRWLPGVTVTTDRPAVACLAAQYAGWRVDREGYFAMGSGPARALIRAEDLYDDLDWDEHAGAAVLCLETRDAPPAEVADYVAQRAGVAAARR